MVEFNRGIQVGSDPSYLGYSKERSGDQTVATAIKGIGNLLIQGTVAADEIIQDNIKSDLVSGVQAIGEELGGGAGPQQPTPPATATDTEPAGGAADTDGTVDIFGEDKTSATTNPDIQKNVESARRLTQAYQRGKISQTAYWGKMSTLSKELKARYAGYSEIIDRQFQGVTGQIPATALANARRKEYLGYLSTINEEEKFFSNFTKSNIAYLPPDYYERAKAGNPYTKMEVFERVHRLKSRQLEQDALKDNLAIKTSLGNLSQEEAIGAASDVANTRVNAILADTASQELINQMTSATRQAASGQVPSPEQTQALRAQFGLFKLQVEQAIEADLRRPTSDGKYTYYSLIKDPAKIKAIKEQAIAPVDNLAKLLEDKDYGLFASALNYSKAAEANTKSTMLKDPYWRYIGAAKELGGTEVLGEMVWRPEYEKFKNNAVKAGLDMMAGKTVAGVPDPLVNQMQTVNREFKADKEEVKLANRGLIAKEITALVSPNASQTSMSTAAENMFGEGNSNFLLHFEPKRQQELYDRMVAPNVTVAMQKVRETKPQLWDKYREWAKSSFVALQSANASTVQEGFTEREEIKLEWDAKANQFTWTQTAVGAQRERQRAEGTESFISGVEGAFTQDVTTAVRNINRQIKLLEGVLKVDGSDVSKEILTLLSAMNINTLTPKQHTLFQKLRRTLDEAVNPPEEGPKE